MEKTKITQEVLNDILKVRDSGLTNMFDLETVKFCLYLNRDYRTLVWVDEHRKEYLDIIFGRFEIAKE